MTSFWFSRRSCCCRLLQLKEKTKTEIKTPTSFVYGRPEWSTDCRESRVWKRQRWWISKRSRRRVEGVVLHKKSLVVRDSCLLETKTLVVLFQVIWGKYEAILQLTSTSSPPFPHSLLCFVFSSLTSDGFFAFNFFQKNGAKSVDWARIHACHHPRGDCFLQGLTNYTF